MANTKRKNTWRTANSKFQALPVDALLPLSTLAAETVIGALAYASLEDDFWMQSCDLTWSMHNHVAGEGPLSVGLSNSDLTIAEIDEAIEAAPTSRSDIVVREQARRPIRRVGVFPGLLSEEVLNDGKSIWTTLKMYMAEGANLVFFVENKTAQLTGATIINIYGTIYGEWR